MLFKELAGVDAFPICLDTKDPDKIVETVKLIAPVFGGINLEDIAAPALLRGRGAAAQGARHPGLPRRPARHRGGGPGGPAQRAQDRQARTSERLRVVVSGVGAAGTATIKILARRRRSRHRRRGRARHDSPRPHGGDGLHEAVGRPRRPTRGVVGRHGRRASGARTCSSACRCPRVLTAAGRAHHGAATASCSRWRTRCRRSSPRRSSATSRSMATGRSDYPNQINNVLCFPGFFRGLLDSRARAVNDEMKIAAARAIASCVGGASSGPSTSSRACSTRPWRRRWPGRSRRPRSRPAWRGAAARVDAPHWA